MGRRATRLVNSKNALVGVYLDAAKLVEDLDSVLSRNIVERLTKIRNVLDEQTDELAALCGELRELEDADSD